MNASPEIAPVVKSVEENPLVPNDDSVTKRTESDRILLKQLGKKMETSSSENWEEDLAATSLENLRY